MLNLDEEIGFRSLKKAPAAKTSKSYFSIQINVICLLLNLDEQFLV
jgi:hypothetical protein